MKKCIELVISKNVKFTVFTFPCRYDYRKRVKRHLTARRSFPCLTVIKSRNGSINYWVAVFCLSYALRMKKQLSAGRAIRHSRTRC